MNLEDQMPLIRTILNLYVMLLIIDSILSYFPQFDREKWRYQIKKIANYSLEPIRKKIPAHHLPIDISPIIVILIIQLVKFLW
jgi:YggT family protein